MTLRHPISILAAATLAAATLGAVGVTRPRRRARPKSCGPRCRRGGAAHLRDRPRERGLLGDLRTRFAGHLPERHPAPGGGAHRALLRHRAQQPRQLHRPGLRPVPTLTTQADCAVNGFVYTDVTPGTPMPPDGKPRPGRRSGCVYPAGVAPSPTSSTPSTAEPKTTWPRGVGTTRTWATTHARRRTPDPSGGTDCAHPSVGAPDTAEVATASDQYTTRHNPSCISTRSSTRQPSAVPTSCPSGPSAPTARRAPWAPRIDLSKSSSTHASPSSRRTCAATATTARAPGSTATVRMTAPRRCR